nr:putative transposase (putative), gypsy type [Tanacetum cinerariifolium]
MLHPELPGSGNRTVHFPEGKVGVYTRFFEFANFRLPISQFLFDVLGYYQIHLSQLSVIGAAKVSHFEINCRVQNIVPTLSLLRVFYTPSFNSGWMSFSKRSGKNTPHCYTKPLDSLKNWNNRFFWVDECVFPLPWSGGQMLLKMGCRRVVPIPWRLNGPIQLNTCSKSDKGEDREPSPCPAPHELPLLTLTAPRVIEMDEPAAATDSSGVPSAIERSPLDFADEAEASGQETAASEVPPPKEVPITTVPGGNQAAETVAVEPPAVQESRKRGHEGIDANAPPKSLRRDHDDLRPSGSARGEKSLASMQLCLASNIFMYEGVPADVSDPDPLA